MKRILALICVLACLCGFALPALANPDVITVTAEVPADWTNVHLYVWIDDTTNLLAWPGTPMNKADDGRYTLEIPAGYPYVIVNNGEGGAQTQDMEMDGASDVWITVSGTYGEVLYYDPGVGNIGNGGETGEPAELTSMSLVGEGDDELDWAPDNTNYNMTVVEPGVFTKDITLYKGTTIKFKLCGNGSWDGGYNMGGNADGVVLTAGTAVELLNSGDSKDLSYTATQDCTLTVTVDTLGDVPTVTVKEAPASLEPAPEKTMVKIYVSVAGDYTPNMWAWGDNGNAFAAWPGEPMTKEGDWWVIEIPDDCHSAIVNDGAGQTSDLAITMGAENWIVVDATFGATVSASEPEQGATKPEPKPEQKPTEPEATKPEANKPAEKSDEDSKEESKGGVNIFMIITIVLIVITAGAVVATVIILKKKKG